MAAKIAEILKLAKLGFKLFPVAAYYDHDARKWRKPPATKNGFKDASSDSIQVNAAFNSAPCLDPWVGMVHNDMTILDADGEQGVETLNRILPLVPPAAVVVQTVSGGAHYYIPGSIPGASRDTRALPGLDILTGNDRGFTIVPPSYGYRIIEGSFEELARGIHEVHRKAEGQVLVQGTEDG